MADNYKGNWFLMLIFNNINVLVFAGTQLRLRKPQVWHVISSMRGEIF